MDNNTRDYVTSFSIPMILPLDDDAINKIINDYVDDIVDNNVQYITDVSKVNKSIGFATLKTTLQILKHTSDTLRHDIIDLTRFVELILGRTLPDKTVINVSDKSRYCKTYQDAYIYHVNYGHSKFVINRRANDYHCGLLYACRIGDVNLAKQLAKRTTNYDKGLEDACIGNNTDCIELMIKLGATDYMKAMYSACKASSYEAVKILGQRVTTECYDAGLWGACASAEWCDPRILILMLYKCSKYGLDKAIGYACAGGSIKLIRIISILSDNCKDYNFNFCYDAFIGACKGGRAHVIDDLFTSNEISNALSQKELNEGLLIVCKNGGIECAQRLIKWGANKFTKGYEIAYKNGHEDIAKLMAEHKNH